MVTAVHHFSAAHMEPLGSFAGRLMPTVMVAHCLLVEGAEGLTLVDTGFGTVDLAQRRMGRAFQLGARLGLDRSNTALAHVEALGFQAGDVRTIVVTHLDLDHAGGIGDFPNATVHVFADELEAARKRASLLEKQRYIPAQWAGANWLPRSLGGESWLGFEAVKLVSDEVLLIPMRGHTRGHCAVAVRRPSGGWFLHAGDAYFDAGEKSTPPTCLPGLRTFQTLMQMDAPARVANQERLRTLHAEHGPESGSVEPVTIFCAHSEAEFLALADTTD